MEKYSYNNILRTTYAKRYRFDKTQSLVSYFDRQDPGAAPKTL